MHKLFKADLALITLTLVGLSYLTFQDRISFGYALTLLLIYLSAKVIGYLILPYTDFDTFITYLSDSSLLPGFPLSGFELFKTTLVALLFLGFVLIDPSFWIIESILVVMMRIWGVFYLKASNQ